MSDPLDLTPGALASRLADLDEEGFVSFVVDLHEREGWTVRREGALLTLTRPDGDRARVLVRADDRDRLERLLGRDRPTPGSLDAVVARPGDGDAARAIAADTGARVVDTGELHDRLLYAIPRADCRDLCHEHFGREVEPRPSSWADEPVLELPIEAVTAVAVTVILGVLVATATGIPGGHPADATEHLDVATPPPHPVTPVGVAPGTATSTTGSSRGLTPGEPWGVDDRIELSTGGDPLRAVQGSTVAVVATLRYDVSVTVASSTAALQPPDTDWAVDPANGTGEPVGRNDGMRRFGWNLTVPDDARGEYEATVVVHYIGGNDVGSIKQTLRIVVAAPTPVPTVTRSSTGGPTS